MNPNLANADPKPDDATPDFAKWTQDSTGSAAAAELDAMFGGGAKAEQPAPGAAAPVPGRPPERTLGQKVGAVAADVGKGLIESPIQAVGGVRDAAQATIDLWIDAGNYLEKNFPLGRIGEGDGSGPQLPEVKQPTTVTSGLFRGVSQFVTGFIGAGKIKGVAAAGKFAVERLGRAGEVLTAMVKGGIADFTAFDPHQQRLSNLIEQFPMLKNPVSDYLAAKPDDTAAEGRFKNFVEGLGLGVAGEGLVRVLKVFRSAVLLKSSAEAPDAARAIETPANQFEALGDPTGDLFIQKKLAAAERDAAKLTPGAARAAEDTAHLRDTRGQGEIFHGTSRELSSLSEGHYVSRNIYGQGFYTTDAIEIARGYTRKGRGNTPTIYRVTEKIPVKLFDMETPIPDDLRAFIEKDQSGSNSLMLEAFDDGAKTLRQVYDYVREVSASQNVSADDVQELFAGVQEFLEKQGFGGLRHIGGKLTKAPEHEVKIYFNPERDLNIEKVDQTTYSSPSKAVEDAQPDVFINFARIEAPEDIQKVMQTMADANAGTIRRNARGVRTWEDTKLSADQQNAWRLLMERRRGEPLNAEQSLAARQLWVTSATKLQEMAKIAVAAPSETNLFAFRKMLATHYAIQSEIIAARTETARALNAWKIPAGAGAEQAQQIEFLMGQAGGDKVSLELADKIARLSDAGMANALEQMVKGSVLARTSNAVQQVWINALLTNPTTHVVNAMSNWTVILQQILERKNAAFISKALGTQSGVEMGEAAAMASAMVMSFGDALRAAWRTTRSGESAFPSGKVEIQGALSPEMWNVAKNNPLGMALNAVDVATRAPGRLLGIGDEFFKTIGYRAELASRATRMAAAEVSNGSLSPLLSKKRAAEIMANPPEDVKLDAVSAALYSTFTGKPAETLKKIGDAIQNIPIFGRILLPFKNTPINILTYTAERGPFAPLVKQWRMDVAAGGARRDIALSRMATGSMVMAATMDMAMSGTITGAGPQEPAQRQAWIRAGNQPYSVKVGNRWFSYGRLDPLGMTLGMGADMAEAMQNAGQEFSQKDFEEVFVQSMFAVSNNVLSKTYMSGITEFFNAITDPQASGEKYFQRLASSLVPAGVAAAARQVDPYMRTADSALQALRRRIPGLSADLPPYRDLWGRPVDYRSGEGAVYDILSPIYIKKINPEPVDTELQRLEYYPSMPDRRMSINGVTVELDGKQYSRFVQLAGNGVKDLATGLGAKDFLNAAIEGKGVYGQLYKLYSDGPDGGKASFIAKWLSTFREEAKARLLKEDGALKAQYEQNRKQRGGQFQFAVPGL